MELEYSCCSGQAFSFGSHDGGAGEGAEEGGVGGGDFFSVQRIASDGGEEAVVRIGG